MKRLSLLPVLSLLLFFSCQKTDFFTGSGISDQEIRILQECRANPLPGADAIRASLVGEWRLAAYACTGCAPQRTPEARITFTENQGTLQYKSTHEEFALTFSWSLSSSGNNFVLETDPPHRVLQFTDFCSGYIIQDSRVGDGDMHAFRKK